MRKHRLTASFARSAVAAGAVVGAAVATGQPASAAAAAPGPNPTSAAADHLVLATVPTAPAFGRELTLGAPWMRGPDVLTLQSRYEAHGFHLAVDGIFGPETENVTKAFQVSKGLAADGVVGPSTWAAAFDQRVSSPVVHQAAPTATFTAPTVQHTATFVAPPPAPTQHAVASSSGSSVAGGGVWAALRQCESGGSYSTNTGNGYGGAYQFTQQTWSAVGMSGSPSSASPAQQDAAAQKLQAQSGWGQWPACSAKLGLR